MLTPEQQLSVLTPEHQQQEQSASSQKMSLVLDGQEGKAEYIQLVNVPSLVEQGTRLQVINIIN